MDTLQVFNPSECIECVQHAVNKDWTAAITCAITVASGVIIRFLEKRRIKRNQK
jgi:hypothetical protein